MSKSPGRDDAVSMLEFFKNEIKSEDQSIRLYAVQRVSVVANYIGSDKTVSDLLPLLYELSKQEQFLNDDEFLFRLAEQYLLLLNHVSGKLDLLIPQVEWLAYQEETVIRDKAVEVLGVICSHPSANVQTDIIPALNRLASAEWFTARLSVCALFQHAYPKASDSQKQDLRKLYSHLAGDETPMVRRAAALRLKEFCMVVERQHIQVEILPVYRQLSQDDTQDIIRVACVHTSLVLIENHFKDNPEENKTHTLLVLTAATEDRSWRVRLTVAQSFARIVQALGREMTSSFLMNPFVQLLKDNEQEVRAAAVSVLGKLCSDELFTSEQLQNFVVPQFATLATVDPSQMVKAALGGVIHLVAVALGKDLTQKLLLTSISDLMKDDAHEVRLQVVSHAAEICAVLGLEVTTHSLLVTIQGLVMDNQWRIRKSVIEQMPELAKQFGKEVFEKKLESIIFESLNDSVHAVRFAALKNVGIICKNFGAEWTTSRVLAKVTEQYNENSGFSTRITVLHTLPEIAQVMTKDEVQTKLLPILRNGLNDSVPNVRYCACKKLLDSSNFVEKITISAVKQELDKLVVAESTDPDVAQLAREALKIGKGVKAS